ncbi:MAG TPA: hypothetical protein VFI31_01465 [Pirellulales bacterium]|nr:hypothetical protein [Pirellulales bacterium]
MDELSPEAARPMQETREVVRRFDSRKNVKRAKRRGIRFDATKGNGIPATTTDIEPVDPDRIKNATGARNADAWMDIDVTNKRVRCRFTKAGQKEIVILEDVDAGQILASGRTSHADEGAEDE